MKSDRNLHTFVICAYKESIYLEECIRSVLKQSVASDVIIASSTPNEYIQSMAKKYQLPMKINPVCNGIGSDFDFALSAATTPFVTIAHQDDTYGETFAEEVLKHVTKDMLICFTDYREGRADGSLIELNRNLKIKKWMLLPMRIPFLAKSSFVRRRLLSLGNPISCPTVTFRRKKIEMPLFASDMKSNIDWMAWARLAKEKGRFVYIPKELMMHRIHQEATTTVLIHQNKREAEDLRMLMEFWPKPIAKLINRFYNKAEESVSNL